MMNEMPVIRFEVERMKQAILVALSDYQLRLDSDIKQAVEDYCTEGKIKETIKNAIERTLDAVLNDEVKRFYLYGDGRSIIKAAIEKKLKDNETYTMLDKP